MGPVIVGIVTALVLCAAIFLGSRGLRRTPTALPRMIATYLGFQKFLGARSRPRCLALAPHLKTR